MDGAMDTPWLVAGVLFFAALAVLVAAGVWLNRGREDR